MSYKFFSHSGVMLGSTSTATSSPVFVGDFRTLTVSWQSKASLGASRFTIWGSNADGLQAQDVATSGSLTTGWSLYSGVNMVGGTTPGVVVLNPVGIRWARVSVDVATQSAASYTTITYNGTTY